MTLHSSDDELDPGLLERYWSGTASPEEIASVTAWLSAHPEWEARYDTLLAHLVAGAWDALPVERVDHLMAGALQAMGVQHVPDEPPTASSKTSRRKSTVPWGRVAGLGAAVLLFVGGLRAVLNPPAPAPTVAGVETFVTQAKEHLAVTLTDGSRVVLAPQTQLRVSPEFGRSERTVSLIGQAYFEVLSATGTPFIVQAGGVATRVLGTAFDIRHYPDDSDVRVAVVSGKVTASSDRASVTLIAGTMAHVTDSTAASMPIRDAQMYSAWTQGRLVFRDVPASAMLATLGRWYGYEFQLADSALAARHVSATFDVKEHTEAMAIVKYLLDVTMTFRGDTIILQVHGKSDAPAHRWKQRVRPDFLRSNEVGK